MYATRTYFYKWTEIKFILSRDTQKHLTFYSKFIPVLLQNTVKKWEKYRYHSWPRMLGDWKSRPKMLSNSAILCYTFWAGVSLPYIEFTAYDWMKPNLKQKAGTARGKWLVRKDGGKLRGVKSLFLSENMLEKWEFSSQDFNFKDSILVFWIVLTLENDESFNVPKQTTRQTTLFNWKIYCFKTFQHFQNVSCAKVQVSLSILSF